MAGSAADLLYVQGLVEHCSLPGVGRPGYQQLLLGSLKSLQARRFCERAHHIVRGASGDRNMVMHLCRHAPNEAQNKLRSQHQ